jgi:hypothetical protein
MPIIQNINGVLSTNTANSYKWLLNGFPIPGATGQTLLPTQSGDYSVTVGTAAGCFGTSAPVPVTAMGTSTPEYTGSARVYPNPATDIIHINAPASLFITVTTLDGRTVLEQKNSSQVSIGHLPAGLYIVILQRENGAVLLREKLVKVTP